MAMQAKRVVQKDNGYFEVVEVGCGHHVRVRTEDIQWEINEARRRANRQSVMERHSCGQCRQEATS